MPDVSPDPVERDAELAVLRRAVRQARAGRSVVVSVDGPPGCGHSTLLARAAKLAVSAGLPVFEHRCAARDQHRRYGLRTDLLTAARRAPDRSRGCVIVDDAQWADPESTRWIRARAATSEGGWLLVLARPYDGRAAAPEIAAQPAAAPDQDTAWHVITLRPLTGDGVRAVLSAAYAHPPDEELVRAAVEATGGSPALLAATLRLCPPPAPAPDTFRALADQAGRHRLERLLAPLPADLLPLVRAAAIGGAQLTFDQVCAVAGVAPQRRAEARAQLIRCGLLGEGSPPRLDRLTAEHVLAGTPGPVRRELYAAAAVLAHAAGMPDPAVGRLLLGADVREPWATGVLRAAARQASAAGDPHLADQLFARALEGAPDARERCEVLLELAGSRAHAGPHAADRYRHEVLLAATDPALAQYRLAAADLSLATSGGADAAQAIGTAYRRSGRSDPDRATLLGLYWLAAADRFAPAELTLPDIPTIGEIDGDRPPPAGGDAAQFAAMAWRHCLRGGPRATACALARAALRHPPTDPPLFAPRLAAVRVLMLADEAVTAGEELRGIEARARGRGARDVLVPVLLTRADLALRQGRLDAAEHNLAEALDVVPRRHWSPSLLPRLVALEIMLRLERGRPDLAALASATAERAFDRYDLGWIQLMHARGVLELRSGRPRAAVARLRECGRWLSGNGVLNPAVVPWRARLAAAHQAAGEPIDAAALLDDELASALTWGAASTVGGAHLSAGLILRDTPLRLSHLNSAVALLAESSAQSRYAEALLELARLRMAAGQPGPVERLLREAGRVIREHGYGQLAGDAAELSGQYERLARLANSRLSPAQRRVAGLAAAGQPNSVIAARLSVTRRTVELHLTNIYQTLGIAGRAELRGALGRRDGEPDPPLPYPGG